MWSNFLRFEPDLLDDRERILDLGRLETFRVERGITDELWRKDPAQPSVDNSTSSLFEELA